MMSDGGWSERTFARYYRGIRLALVFELPEEVVTGALTQCSRPGGSINVSRFAERIEDIVAARIVAS